MTEQERRVMSEALDKERTNLEAQIDSLNERLETEEREEHKKFLRSRVLECERMLAKCKDQIELYKPVVVQVRPPAPRKSRQKKAAAA